MQEKSVSRRNFLAGAGALGAATVVAGCSNSKQTVGTVMPPPTQPAGPTDADILTFALNLEYLEAEFYLRAATGNGLVAADLGANPGAVVGGTKVPNLTLFEQNILNEIAFDEQSHVEYLRGALLAAGATVIDRPALDLVASFAGIATVANSLTIANTAMIPSTFNPFADFDSFLVGAFAFEDVGVSAYHGAAGSISSAAYLSAAAGILAVEAYHAGYVRTSLTARAIAAGAVPGTTSAGTTAYPYIDYANRIASVRAAVGGGASTETLLVVPVANPNAAAGNLPFATASTIVAKDPTAIAIGRSPQNVLNIVYGMPGTGVTKGGFFPNGVSGTIATT